MVCKLSALDIITKKIETNKSASGHVSDQISSALLHNCAGGGQCKYKTSNYGKLDQERVMLMFWGYRVVCVCALCEYIWIEYVYVCVYSWTFQSNSTAMGANRVLRWQYYIAYRPHRGFAFGVKPVLVRTRSRYIRVEYNVYTIIGFLVVWIKGNFGGG